MKFFTSSLTVTIMMCGVVALTAQTPSSDTTTKGKNTRTLVVTGCVVEDGGHYMLDHAMMGIDGTKSPSPSASHEMASYKLMGGDLKTRVGQKVEITGMMSNDSVPKDSMPKDKTASMKTTMLGTLDVKSVKLISPSCS